MVMECNERLAASINLCQYEKIKCTSPSVNGSKFCTRHLHPSHQCTYVRAGNQCKNRISGHEQRTLCSTHLAARASRKRRRTDAPSHKDNVNKTPPLALHVFRIMTQERQRLKFKPNIYKRPLEHLKWVMKREKMDTNPIYPTGMEAECQEYDAPHDTVTVLEKSHCNSEEMRDVRCRSVYLAKVEERLHERLDSLICQIGSLRRSQSEVSASTKAITEAARSSISKTTSLLSDGVSERTRVDCSCTLPNKATRYTCCVCNKRALPFTKFCVHHILQDAQQLLFSECNTVLSSSEHSCPAPTVSITGRPCSLHSLLERYGVTESHDIETESSSSESEVEETPVLEPVLNSWSPSPIKEKKTSSPPPPITESNHVSTPIMVELDMLPMQPDTILESSSLPEEPDIPLPVRFMEPNLIPNSKRIRTQEEELQARALTSQYLRYSGGLPLQPGCYPPYSYPPAATAAPVQYLHGYNKEGEPIYGYHDNKQHDYQKYMQQQQPNSGSENGSRPATPVVNHDVVAQFYQHQRFMYPLSPDKTAASPSTKKKQVRKKKKDHKSSKSFATKNPVQVVQTPLPHDSSRTPDPSPTSQIPPPQSSQPHTVPQSIAPCSTPQDAVPKPSPMLTAPREMPAIDAVNAGLNPEPRIVGPILVSEQKSAAKSGVRKPQNAKNTPSKPKSTVVSSAPLYAASSPAPSSNTAPNMAPSVTVPSPNMAPHATPVSHTAPPTDMAALSAPLPDSSLSNVIRPPESVRPPDSGRILMSPHGGGGLVTQPSFYPTYPPPGMYQANQQYCLQMYMQPNGAVGKTTDELSDYQKYTLQQQRQQQMLIAAQGQMTPFPQQYYHQNSPPSNSPAKSEKKRKSHSKSKSDPNGKKKSVSEVPKTGNNEDGVNYFYPGHVLMPMSHHPIKGGYVNGSAPLYLRVDEHPRGEQPDNKAVVINDAVLARNRPSSVLMQNPGWVERYIKKPDKARSKSKASPRRSPQKPVHRNLIFHNTEIGTISDKLAKQQKNAQQRSSHKALCNKSKSEASNHSGTPVLEKAEKLFIPDKPDTIAPPQAEGVT